MRVTREPPSAEDAVALGGPPRRPPRPSVLVAGAWALGLGAVAAGRFRGQWDAYRAMHRWLAGMGVADFVRHLDSLILFAAAAFLGARLAAAWGGASTAGRLGLRRGRSGWGRMVVFALLPMVGGGLALGWARGAPEALPAGILSKFVGGVLRAPLAEELLFRGLLVGVCAGAIGWRGRRFWTNATAAALLFAATHVPWTAPAIAGGWPTLLVTGVGGLWYAWLLAKWGSLWVPMALHAGMNLGWMLAGASGGAGGGGWIENALRVATIALATGWTARRVRDPAAAT